MGTKPLNLGLFGTVELTPACHFAIDCALVLLHRTRLVEESDGDAIGYDFNRGADLLNADDWYKHLKVLTMGGTFVDEQHIVLEHQNNRTRIELKMACPVGAEGEGQFAQIRWVRISLPVHVRGKMGDLWTKFDSSLKTCPPQTLTFDAGSQGSLASLLTDAEPFLPLWSDFVPVASVAAEAPTVH